MKRGVSILLVILVIIMSTSAVADLSAVFGPDSAFETTTNLYQINVTNVQSPYKIVEVKAEMLGFEIISMLDYEGWTSNYEGNEAVWSDGLVSNNVYLAKFDLYAKALAVDTETQTDAEIKLKDTKGDYHTFIFPITILDDETAPNVTVLAPLDGYVKEGESETTFSAQIEDPETGIASATLHWQECDDENATAHDLQLALSEGIYSTTIDLSGYEDGETVCYTLTATNGGGDVTVHNGTLTIDGIPPEVNLIAPLDGAAMGLTNNFSFFASDNLETDMRCSMYIDGVEYITDIEAQHMDVEFIPAADAEEGAHTWSVKCTDPAGWEGDSATWEYNMDKTPPVISMTAPENDSIVADTTTVDLEVSDNLDLWKVHFVFNGTQEEIEPTSSIDLSDWPDGPSEFTVQAVDAYGNRAEQTYRIIVDRSPPAVDLVAPAESTTTDVHMEISYIAQDDYDDVMDCRVYIDDAGEEQHTAMSDEVTTQTEIVPTGDHRWKVQCVDDAGNSGESNERQVTVMDASGPDIVFGLPDEIQRGHPVTISLHITDPSGVEAVVAELRDTDNHTQTVPLQRDGDDYTALIETETDWTPGTYTLVVDAVDTLNFSTQSQDSFEVKLSYAIDMELEPATTAPNSNVIVSGAVIYDNGSLVPEQEVTLTLPGNVTETAVLDDGRFEHTFTSPATDGDYEILLTVAGYLETSTLQVVTPTVQTHTGGGGSSSYNPQKDDEPEEECEPDWQCTAFTPCSSGTQTRTCVDINKCGDTTRRQESQICLMAEEETENDDTDEEGTVTATREPLPDDEEYKIDATEKNKGVTAGVGKASSFINIGKVKLTDLLLVVGLMGLLLGVLYKYGWSKGDNRSRPAAIDFMSTKRDRLGLEDYLNDRASRKRW